MATMPHTSEDIFRDWYTSLQQMLDEAANKDNYKDGALKGKIKAQTPPLKSIIYFMTLPQTTVEEREVFRIAAYKTAGLLKEDMATLAQRPVMGRTATISLDLRTVFDADVLARGGEVSPITRQFIDAQVGITGGVFVICNNRVLSRYDGKMPGIHSNATL